MSQPAISSGRRPKRSESAPPGVLESDLTRLRTAQMIGSRAAATPRREAWSSRKASLELPRVKTNRTARKAQKRPPRRVRRREGLAAAFSAPADGFDCAALAAAPAGVPLGPAAGFDCAVLAAAPD